MSKRPNPKPTNPAEAGRPTKPSGLGRQGSTLWTELVNILSDRQTLTKADRRALELTCRAYEEYRQTEAVLRKKGTSYETQSTGGALMIRPRPEATQCDSAWKRVMKGLIEFGLTPASRSRVPGAAGGKDSFDEWLSK